MADPNYKSYFAAPEFLPDHLPGLAEVLEDDGARHHIRVESRVVTVKPHYAIKFGTKVELTEGETMLFVHKACPDLPIPEVYAFYRDKTYNVNVIITEHIDGTPLDDCKAGMSENQSNAVMEQIRDFTKKLREIPSEGYFGSVGKGRVNSLMFQDLHRPVCPHAAARLMGPFPTLWAFHDGLILAYISEVADHRHPHFVRSNLLEPCCHETGDGSKPVFTHGNLHPRNIIVRPDGVIFVTDFSRAGFMPVYWEYVIAMTEGGKKGSWGDGNGFFATYKILESHLKAYLAISWLWKEISDARLKAEMALEGKDYRERLARNKDKDHRLYTELNKSG